MIPPPTACLVFKPGTTEISCTGGEVCLELVGEGVASIDTEMIRQVAAGVLHYFREEQGRTSITVGEFAEALVRVLKGFGMHVGMEDAPVPPSTWNETDLIRLAGECDGVFELAFFPRLRREIDQQVNPESRVLKFTGLRECVKRLSGARRWSGRCEEMSDQIVAFLRHCLSEHPQAANHGLVIL